MADTWYDPQELKDQADGDQTAPEFDPEATPGYDETVGGDEDGTLTALVDRANAIAAIVDTFTQ